jgi:hypothetical protein
MEENECGAVLFTGTKSSMQLWGVSTYEPVKRSLNLIY